MHLGTWEIVVVLVIVLLLFGPGRITKVASEMGKGLKAFKDGLNEDETKKEDEIDQPSESDSDAKK